jgi:GTPase SAR1 family protein
LSFVVDSNDATRIDEAIKELYKLLEEDELREAILLLYVNKQDLPNAIKTSELDNKLKLNKISNMSWQFRSVFAITGDVFMKNLIDFSSKSISVSKCQFTHPGSFS